MQDATAYSNRFAAFYRRLPARAIATTGIVLSLIASLLAWQWEQEALRSELHEQADHLQDRLQKAILLQQVNHREAIATQAVSETRLVRDLLTSALSGLDLADLDIYVWQGELRQQPQSLALYRFNQHAFAGDLEAHQPKLTGRGWLCPEFSPPTRSATGQAFRQMRQVNRSTGKPCERVLEWGDRRLSFLLLPTSEYVAPYRYWHTWSSLILGVGLATALAIYLQVSQHYMQQVEGLIVERTQKANMLQNALHELQNTQTMLVHSERMSALGQMLAGIVHEINNPVQFVSGNLGYLNEYTQNLLDLLNLYQQHYPPATVPAIAKYAEEIELDFVAEDLPNIVGSMRVGVERIVQIVSSMRNFSRLDETSMKEANLHDGLDSTLLILYNRLKAKDKHPEIRVIKNYGDLPLVPCYSGQINQVFMNIIANAIDALRENGEARSPQANSPEPDCIQISTSVIGDRVRIQIADNGPGIAAEIQERIFQPFFTTKPTGKGTGLGMSISHKIIVEKHGGALSCHSELGQGTEFRIELPIQQSKLE